MASAVSSDSVGMDTTWIAACDDPRNAELVILHHFPITLILEGGDRGRDEKVGIHYGDSLLGYGRGELAVWLVKFAWIRAFVKAGLSDHLDQQKCKPKKKYTMYAFSSHAGVYA